MITSRILGNSRGLVFGLMVEGRLRFDDDCMRLNWGSEYWWWLELELHVEAEDQFWICLLEEHLDFIMVVCHWSPWCNVVWMQQMNKIELSVL